jgi:hypothetical protein
MAAAAAAAGESEASKIEAWRRKQHQTKWKHGIIKRRQRKA